MAPTRSWWRSYFTDHPRLIAKDSEAYSPGGKAKVLCNQCLNYKLGRIATSDTEEIVAGTRTTARSAPEITLLLFREQIPHGIKWLESRGSTLQNHLKMCTRIPEHVREMALQELNKRGSQREEEVRTPRAIRTYMMTEPTAPIPYPTWAGFNSDTSRDERAPFPLTSALSTPQRYMGAVAPSPNQEEPVSDLFSHNTSLSRLSTARPPPSSLERPESATLEPGRPMSKRLRVESLTGSLSRHSSYSDSQFGTGLPWSLDRQRVFEEKLLRITASANLAFSWIENPEVVSFLEEFLPHARLPTRRSLSTTIMTRYMRGVRRDAQGRANGRLVTIQCDGWTGLNNHHIIAFMMTGAGPTADEKELFTVKLNDTTVERKTARNLLPQILQVITILKQKWNVTIIGFTSDASGESRKARRLLLELHPEMVVLDCYVHQINLIVGDYFKAAGPEFHLHASRANDLITWLRSKTAILGLIREQLILHNQPPKSVIRPVPTRWTAYYLAYTRLLDLHEVLELITRTDDMKVPDEKMWVQGDKAAKAKAVQMKHIIHDHSFWQGIARIQRHLAPLAVAANITQSTFCRLDEVLLTFGSLFITYEAMDDPDDLAIVAPIMDSLEKRWEKTDQAPFIASVILNPFLQNSPFVKTEAFSVSAINNILLQLWRRFFGDAPPPEFQTQIRDYLMRRGSFSDMTETVTSLIGEAVANNVTPNPLRFYTDRSVPGVSPPALIRLAVHLLSICPNSASCERLFSTFGLILTKLRTRLGVNKMLDLAELKLHLRDEHIRNGSKKEQRHRAFGVWQEKSGTPSDFSATASSERNPDTATSSSPIPSSDVPNELPNSTSQSLRSMTTRLEAMVDLDRDPPTLAHSSGSLHFQLSGLFDKKDKHWIHLHSRSPEAALQDELKIYELFNLDAPGEPELDYDLDESVENILTT